jgi:hypothetical protein
LKGIRDIGNLIQHWTAISSGLEVKKRMTGHYAVPVHLEVYIDNPEYTSVFRPRIHRKSLIADHASLQCQLDLYGDESVGRNFGSLNGHVGNFTSLCAPNCMPERLALVSYTIEYAFLHDGMYLSPYTV